MNERLLMKLEQCVEELTNENYYDAAVFLGDVADKYRAGKFTTAEDVIKFFIIERLGEPDD